MAQDPQAPGSTTGPGAAIDVEPDTGPDIVEWGERSDRPPPRLLNPASRVWAKVQHHIERHLDASAQVTGVLAAGAVLAGLSLVTTWQVTRLSVADLDTELPQAARPELTTGIAGLESLGDAYLLGLLGLAGLTVLALRGTPAARRHARLAGLGVAVALVAVLLAAVLDTMDDSVLLRYSEFPGSRERYQVGYGAGPFLALAGVLLVGVGLYRAGRSATREPAEPLPARGNRPPPAPSPLRAPSDLTVSPVPPLRHLPGRLDQR